MTGKTAARGGSGKARAVRSDTTLFKASSGMGVREVRFGKVVVHAASPDERLQERNVRTSRSALSRVRGALLKPGVKVQVKAGVPLYHADPEVPGRTVRVLDGEVTSGRFVGGKFKPAR